jgi:hypothetical protein
MIALPISNERNKAEEAVYNVDKNAKKNASARVIREMKRLESWFNPQATKVIEKCDCGSEILLGHVNMALFTIAFIKEPSSLEGAIYCKRKGYQNAWKKAMDKELNEMTKRGVWEVINEKDVPNDGCCIENMWIFNVKRNRAFRARLVA